MHVIYHQVWQAYHIAEGRDEGPNEAETINYVSSFTLFFISFFIFANINPMQAEDLVIILWSRQTFLCSEPVKVNTEGSGSLEPCGHDLSRWVC